MEGVTFADKAIGSRFQQIGGALGAIGRQPKERGGN